MVGRFGEPVAVLVNSAGMMVASFGIEPIAFDQVAVWVEVSEEAVGDADFPCVVLRLLPTLDNFRAFDDDLFARRSLVDDPFLLGPTACWGSVSIILLVSRMRSTAVARGSNRAG